MDKLKVDFVFLEIDENMEKVNKELRQLQKELERWKSQERDHQEKINEDAKELDKMTNKSSLMLKKVSWESNVNLKLQVCWMMVFSFYLAPYYLFIYLFIKYHTQWYIKWIN